MFGSLHGALLFHFQLLLLRSNLLLERLFSDDYSLHNLFLRFPLYLGSFIAFLRDKHASLLVAVEVRLELLIVGLFLFALELLPLIVLCPRILQNLGGSLACLLSTLPLALSFIFFALRHSLIKHRILSFPQLLNSFLFLIFRFEDVLLLFLNRLHVLVSIFSHSLLQLGLVVFFCHLAVEYELLVQWVSQHDLRWHRRLWHIQAIVMDEVHGVLAENGAWAGSRSEDLLLAALATRGTIHCSWLLENGWELVFNIVDDTRANGFFNLLGEYSSLVLIILESHSSDLI